MKLKFKKAKNFKKSVKYLPRILLSGLLLSSCQPKTINNFIEKYKQPKVLIESNLYFLGTHSHNEIEFKHFPLNEVESKAAKIFIKIELLRYFSLAITDVADSLVIKAYKNGKLIEKSKIDGIKDKEKEKGADFEDWFPLST